MGGGEGACVCVCIWVVCGVCVGGAADHKVRGRDKRGLCTTALPMSRRLSGAPAGSRGCVPRRA